MGDDLIEIKLPDSGLTAFIKSRLSYGEMKKLNSVFQKGATGEMINGQVQTTFSGEIMMQYTEKLFEIFVVKILNEVNDEATDLKAAIDGLAASDGMLLEEKISAQVELLKKK